MLDHLWQAAGLVGALVALWFAVLAWSRSAESGIAVKDTRDLNVLDGSQLARRFLFKAKEGGK